MLNQFKLFSIVSLLLISLGCASFRHTDPALTGPQEYVYEIDASKDELFTRARLWVADTYNSAEAVLTFEDEDSGLLKGTAIGTVRQDGVYRNFKYNLSIYVKDNKSKINIGDISPFSGVTYGIDMTYESGYNLIKPELDALAESYEQFMIKENTSDW